MPLRLHHIVVTLLLLAFAFLLFYGFPDSSAPWFDEGIHLNLARTFAEDGVWSLKTGPGEFVNEKPLLMTTNYPVLLPVALAFTAFGVGLAQAKFVMILFLALFVLLAYRLAKKLYGKEGALVTLALLVTFLPLYGNGKSVLGEVPGLMFFLGGLLLISRERPWPTFFTGALFGLAAATKTSFLIMLGAVAVGELWHMWQKRKFDAERILLLSLGASIPLIVLVWVLLPYEITNGFLERIMALYQNPYDTEGTWLPNLKRFLTESTPLHYLLLLAGVLFAAFRRRLRNLSREEYIMLTFIGLNLIFYLSTVGWYRYFFPSHVLLLVLFPAVLLGAWKHPFRILRNAGIVLLVVVQAGVLIVEIQNPLYHNPVPREFGRAANELIGEEEVVIFDNPEIAFFIWSEKRRLYLQANPRFAFGGAPFEKGLPAFIIAPSWQSHPYLKDHALGERYRLALRDGHYHIYELSQ